MTTGRFPHWEREPEPKPRRWQPSRRVLVVASALTGAGLLLWSCATVQILARIIGAPEAFGYAMALPVSVAVITAVFVFTNYIAGGKHGQ